MSSLQLLIILFLTIPMLEIYLLLKVGGVIGVGWTLALIVGTAVLGAMLWRPQGLRTIARVRTAMDHGELPALELLEGVILLFCGALLLTPGFFTDVCGFLCLIPSVRQQLVLWLVRRGEMRVVDPRATGEAPPGQRTIEGEYWRDDSNGKGPD